MNQLAAFRARGHYVSDIEVVYFSPNIEQTVRWFEETLGWYGNTFDKNEQGAATYGYVSDLPQDIMETGAIPGKTIHIWPGEAQKRVLAFVRVDDLAAVHALVIKNGWTRITDVFSTGLSRKTCTLTTNDGSELMFYQK